MLFLLPHPHPHHCPQIRAHWNLYDSASLLHQRIWPSVNSCRTARERGGEWAISLGRERLGGGRKCLAALNLDRGQSAFYSEVEGPGASFRPQQRGDPHPTNETQLHTCTYTNTAAPERCDCSTIWTTASSCNEVHITFFYTHVSRRGPKVHSISSPSTRPQLIPLWAKLSSPRLLLQWDQHKPKGALNLIPRNSTLHYIWLPLLTLFTTQRDSSTVKVFLLI